MLLKNVQGNFLKPYCTNRIEHVSRERQFRAETLRAEVTVERRKGELDGKSFSMFTAFYCKVCPVGESDCLKLQIRMKVFMWATLLFSVRSSNADTGASLDRTSCHNNSCISLIEGEITAEAGLCVVIPCSFSTASDFTAQNLVWFKCEPSKPKSTESHIIFHSNKKNQNVHPEFKQRVSLLEPEISQNNCSIIINDLKESDSGSYWVRVKSSMPGRQSGSQQVTVSVKGLSQKPTVMIPPLTEGHQATLTCTAPGLCSGSVPEITWTWRRAGVNDSHITGNITDFKAENLTVVTQRHSSTLTFDPSPEHHGTEVTCKVRFTGNMTTEETVTLNVSYVKEVKITGKTSVKEGETLNLTCSVESFPPSFVMWTKLSEQNMQNRTEANLQKDTEPQKQTGMAALSISNVTADHSGQYICTAKHLNHTLKKQANVTVTFMRNPSITGNTTVIMGESLNLTCNVQSFPPTIIMWTKPGPTSLHNGTDTDLQTNSGSATLFIPEMTAEHSGMYRCIVKHMDTTLHVLANVTVIWFPKILSSSGCEVQSDVLTCVCISEGLPLPTIKWPLLENHTEYSVTTTVSNHTVNSTIILTVNHVNRSVECVINNKNWEVKQNFAIRKSLPVQQDEANKILGIVLQLEVIIAFLIGAALSGVFCCLTKQCHRKKQKISGNPGDALEMVTSQDDPLMYDAAAVECEQTDCLQEVQNGPVTAEKDVPELNNGPTDVEYASINFALLKRRSPREAAKTEFTKTVYSEIKKTFPEEDVSGEEGEVLEDKEEDLMIEEDEQTPHCEKQEGDEGEDLEVYSSINDTVCEI
ncbi:hypothetical protein Q8A73_007624 [Channa argus]|nr:hypothetical protein Q8A73_007624 [Channa argus]